MGTGGSFVRFYVSFAVGRGGFRRLGVFVANDVIQTRNPPQDKQLPMTQSRKLGNGGRRAAIGGAPMKLRGSEHDVEESI
jgi:hypothetical protein